MIKLSVNEVLGWVMEHHLDLILITELVAWEHLLLRNFI